MPRLYVHLRARGRVRGCLTQGGVCAVAVCVFVSCSVRVELGPASRHVLFRETRLPRDAVRVLMVLACRRVATRVVSPAVPVHSRAHSFGCIYNI